MGRADSATAVSFAAVEYFPDDGCEGDYGRKKRKKETGLNSVKGNIIHKDNLKLSLCRDLTARIISPLIPFSGLHA